MPNTTYYYSSNIKSFPTTKRESVNKLLTENSLTRLINRLLDVDSFIISDGLAKKLDGTESEIIGNGGKHLEINTNLSLDEINFKDDILEFVIRGYYFSVNINHLLESVSWSTYRDDIYAALNKFGLFARIFIDNTNPDYPELVGQTALEQNNQQDSSGDLYYGVQFFVCPIDDNGDADKPIPFHPSISQDSETITGLGTTYTYYDLLLIEHIRNSDIFRESDYLPFDSLTKFDSHSVRIIDGGEF